MAATESVCIGIPECQFSGIPAISACSTCTVNSLPYGTCIGHTKNVYCAAANTVAVLNMHLTLFIKR